LFNTLFKTNWLFDDLSEWYNYCSKILNKPPIETSQTMKISYLSYRFGCRPISNGLNLVFIHLNTLCSYNIFKKQNFLHAKGTFLKINIQFFTTQYIKHITLMIKMFIQVLVINQNIIKIDNHKFTYKCTQHMIHYPHKWIRCICKSKRYD
jgi:hypothetical protein